MVTGCASAGTKVDPQTLATFAKGQTTVAEVEAVLGDPNGTSTGPDGATVLVYTYSRTSVRAATFIPYVGAFVGGADTKSQSAVLRFGPDGTYQDASTTSGNIGAGVGLAAQ